MVEDFNFIFIFFFICHLSTILEVFVAGPIIVRVAGHHSAVVEVGGEDEGFAEDPVDHGSYLGLSSIVLYFTNIVSSMYQLVSALSLVFPCGEPAVQIYLKSFS